MVSYLAPADLVLQRAGRLHRHERGDRPGPVAAPRLVLVHPEAHEGKPDFGPTGWIYEPYVLLRSLTALQGRREIRIPQDTEELIESVYGAKSGADGPYKEILEEACQEMRKRQAEEVFVAEQKLIGSPAEANLLRQSNLGLREEQPELHRTLQALTRLGPPTVSLVCLHEREGRLFLEPESQEEVRLNEYPSEDLALALAERSVNVSSRAVVWHLLEQPVPEGWRNHPFLRYHRAAVFRQGVCRLQGTGYALRLSRELGLEVVKEST